MPNVRAPPPRGAPAVTQKCSSTPSPAYPPSSDLLHIIILRPPAPGGPWLPARARGGEGGVTFRTRGGHWPWGAFHVVLLRVPITPQQSPHRHYQRSLSLVIGVIEPSASRIPQPRRQCPRSLSPNPPSASTSLVSLNLVLDPPSASASPSPLPQPRRRRRHLQSSLSLTPDLSSSGHGLKAPLGVAREVLRGDLRASRRV